ncbi:hypothetical protein AK812_SmicGene4970 [Symbiodinium microadriaticum]|uniref:Uncharacterized protein n=1 Tax=Symbiodinium microadriaticum TaxID=2951 RepID=A0A1Q9EUV8_SYMMI|nr:hypothetical protein AK812_SmicGene4970 [Symbiodinium microadriaticum]
MFGSSGKQLTELEKRTASTPSRRLQSTASYLLRDPRCREPPPVVPENVPVIEVPSWAEFLHGEAPVSLPTHWVRDQGLLASTAQWLSDDNADDDAADDDDDDDDVELISPSSSSFFFTCPSSCSALLLPPRHQRHDHHLLPTNRGTTINNRSGRIARSKLTICSLFTNMTETQCWSLVPSVSGATTATVVIITTIISIIVITASIVINTIIKIIIIIILVFILVSVLIILIQTTLIITIIINTIIIIIITTTTTIISIIAINFVIIFVILTVRNKNFIITDTIISIIITINIISIIIIIINTIIIKIIIIIIVLLIIVIIVIATMSNALAGSNSFSATATCAESGSGSPAEQGEPSPPEAETCAEDAAWLLALFIACSDDGDDAEVPSESPQAPPAEDEGRPRATPLMNVPTSAAAYHGYPTTDPGDASAETPRRGFLERVAALVCDMGVSEKQGDAELEGRSEAYLKPRFMISDVFAGFP